MIYIKKQLGFYFSEVQLGDTYNVGTTLEDYDNGTFLLLNDDQIAFHEANPDATPLEVWNMEIPSSPEPEPAPEPDTLTIARQQKLQEIADQDAFSNKFFVSVLSGGMEVGNVELWIDRDTRNSLLNNTLPALLSDGETKTKLWTTGMPPQSIEVPIVWALEKLPLVEIYAKRTYDLRASNEAAAYAATTVEEIAQIDPKANYPHFLTFELNLDLGV